MNYSDERDLQISELRERLSQLSSASLRINESLDFDTVLQEVVDSARTLTGSRYGAITVPGEAGQTPHFIVSGVTREEHQGLWEMPQGRGFFDYLSSVEEPLRVSNVEDHLKGLRMPEFAPAVPVTSLLVAPVRHQGIRVGTIYLTHGAEGGEFTQGDEETLVLFASQASMAIANARRYREERRARADLEALVDTSPVGVAVFDARTGLPVLLNREALRIVSCLLDPNQAPEMLLDILTFKRSDGREFSMGDISMVELLSMGETLRAEELVLKVPDGRSATMLINSTPILSDSGVVESMVITLQDMAAVEESERLRADFLAMVSHELRAPLTSIKGSAATVLGSPGDMDPAVVRQFFRIIEDQADHMNDLVANLLDVARIETGTLPITPEPAELAVLVDRARSAFNSAGERNSLAVDIPPNLPLVMADRRGIGQVLGNLFSNAARNSPSSSVIRVSAAMDGIHVAISVADQGRGIPAESLPLLFGKFSRTQTEEQGGDTGLGLAICKGIVEAHGGRIWAESDGPGLGARFTFTLPTVGAAESDTPTTFPMNPGASLRRQQEEARERIPVLAVDDDPNALRYVRDTLAAAGYAPVVTGDPSESLRLLEDHRPRLVLLDLMLPGTDGIELMKDMLALAEAPVIFLSAYGQEEHISRALDNGAVDYVVKPFSPTELLARIRAALRRHEESDPSASYNSGNLAIDYAQRRVTLAGIPVPLVGLEYRLLVELSANAGRVLTYDQLLRRVWGGKSSDIRPMRTVVSKLRRKLGEDGKNPVFIFTEPRVGFWMPKGDDEAE